MIQDGDAYQTFIKQTNDFKHNSISTSERKCLQKVEHLFTKFEFTEPGALYLHYQIKANKTPISIDESSIYSDVARQVERQTLEKALRLCEASKQFWTSKPKSVLQSSAKITTGEIIGQKSVSKINRLEDCSLKLRPYATSWAESKYKTQQMFKTQAQNLEADAAEAYNYSQNNYQEKNKWFHLCDNDKWCFEPGGPHIAHLLQSHL
ncbi:hypothetical protein E3N88_15727 [Mikania micrantha]|uniref:Uncharacterized protein n=1 Tax=Mikania micrantha TaxID=192012 RepID=A0A5N6NXJ9_9ASTR|nr:hypothetical protein E3N88_15727 [Mikania micrantha]